MGQQTTYQGAWPVLVTPFTEEKGIDWPAYETMLEWFLSRQVGGLFAVCLSSEMFDLAQDEREQLARVAVRVARGRVPVVATGSFGDSVQAHGESVRRMAGTGVDAVVLLLPEFARSDDELVRYFDAMLEATDTQFGLYECPVPQRRHLSPTVVARLAKTGRFVCYKETSCDPAVIAAQCAATAGTPLAVLQANVPYMLEARRLGCPGSMCISANVAPELANAALTLTYEQAIEPHRRLCAVDAMLRLNHPVVVKFLLGERGVPLGRACRKKVPELSGEAQVMLREALRFLLPDTGTFPAGANEVLAAPLLASATPRR
jgi:4-hydroxy-tetrahydrodipicolinate synthase